MKKALLATSLSLLGAGFVSAATGVPQRDVDKSSYYYWLHVSRVAAASNS